MIHFLPRRALLILLPGLLSHSQGETRLFLGKCCFLALKAGSQTLVFWKLRSLEKQAFVSDPLCLNHKTKKKKKKLQYGAEEADDVATPHQTLQKTKTLQLPLAPLQLLILPNPLAALAAGRRIAWLKPRPSVGQPIGSQQRSGRYT